MKKKQLTDTLVLVADPAKDDPMLMGWDKKHELYMTKITFLTFCDSTGGHDTPLPGSAAGFKFILFANRSFTNGVNMTKQKRNNERCNTVHDSCCIDCS